MAAKIDFSVVSFLIVDSNPLSADLTRDILMMLGATQIRHIARSDKVFQAIEESEVDVLITENQMEPISGVNLIKMVRSDPESPDSMMPVIMMPASSEPEFVVAARDAGVSEFVAKPFTVESMYSRMVSAIARPRSFVRTSDYFGPDRRRRQVPFKGEDRRR